MENQTAALQNQAALTLRFRRRVFICHSEGVSPKNPGVIASVISGAIFGVISRKERS